MLHHFGLDARLFFISNSAYSRSFCSHSLTEWGCDSICVGCKTGMIAELGICVFSDAIREDYTSPSFNLKMTQHIITARLTHAILSIETTGAMKDEIVNTFFLQTCHETKPSRASTVTTHNMPNLSDYKNKNPFISVSRLSAVIYCVL